MDRLNDIPIRKVKYISGLDTVVDVLIQGKVYDVISIEKGWYRIMTELDDDYLFPPELFEIVEEWKKDVVGLSFGHM